MNEHHGAGQQKNPPFRLAARDAANFYFETDHSPANIVDVYVFEPPQNSIDNAAVVEWLTPRLSRLPIAHCELRRTWADIDYPTWVADDTVDVSNHMTVRNDASWTDTKAIIAGLVSSPMDLSRPPWDATVVTDVDGIGDGIPEGATVVVLRFHHSIGDAVATAGIGRVLFGASPDAVRHVGKDTRLRGIAHQVLRAPIRLAQFAYAIGAGAIVGRQIARAVDRGDIIAPGVSAPETRFDRQLRGRATLGLVHFDLGRMRSVGAAASATVNDVALAVISGALADLLGELGETPEGSLGATIPIAVRDSVVTANRFALGSIVLHTNVPDPGKRLRMIHAQTVAEKARHAHPLIERKRAIAEWIPAFVQRIIGALARRHGPTRTSNSFGNTMVSNVPGNAVGATFMGAGIVDRFGVLAIGDGSGLTHFISSVGSTVSVSFTVDSAAMPDTDRYEELLRAAFASLDTETASQA